MQKKGCKLLLRSHKSEALHSMSSPVLSVQIFFGDSSVGEPFVIQIDMVDLWGRGVLNWGCFLCVLWCIWKEHNRRIFECLESSDRSHNKGLPKGSVWLVQGEFDLRSVEPFFFGISWFLREGPGSGRAFLLLLVFLFSTFRSLYTLLVVAGVCSTSLLPNHLNRIIIFPSKAKIKIKIKIKIQNICAYSTIYKLET